jgi:FtsH-binding integral membrane protein
MQSVSVRETAQVKVRINAFIKSVYNWMALGLGLTGFFAYFVAHSPTLMPVVFKIRWVLIIAELALVFILAGRIQKLKAPTATAMFLVYSILNGATLSIIFLIYTASSIAATFFICAGAFVATNIFGMVTKKDLTGLGSFLFMGFIGIFIASIVNLFIGSHGLQMIISYVGVIVFVGLSAYDAQKLKAMAVSQPDDLDAGVIRKGAIMGALTLYLDFILMFQYLLFILGGSRD